MVNNYAVTLYLLGVEWRQTTWAKLLPTPDKTGRFLRVCEHSILRLVLVLHKCLGYPQMSNLHKRLDYSQTSNYGALQILHKRLGYSQISNYGALQETVRRENCV